MIKNISTKAFTLAEVLITLAIIGIVAVLALPPVIKNYNDRAWSTAQSVFEKRLEVATRQMNTEEKLAGYSSTMDFVNELKKYIKITRVCDNDNITKCFTNEVIANADEDPVDMSTIKDAECFGLDWGTDTVAVQFANGVNAVIAYNPNTTQEPYNNQFAATASSMAILYDVSGNKNPNTVGKDISNINVTKLGKEEAVVCLIPELADKMCITQVLAPGSYSPMSLEDCNKQKDDLGIEACYDDNDYWAGAIKTCGGVNNLISGDQAKDLAIYLLGTDDLSSRFEWVGNDSVCNNPFKWDPDKATLFLKASSSNDRIDLWTNDEASSMATYSGIISNSCLGFYYEGAHRSQKINLMTICTHQS